MKKAAFVALSAILSAASLGHAQASPKVYTPQFDNEARAADDVPQVQVWLNDKSFRYGEEIRPYVITEPGAFLTVIRVSTDGELSVLYPQRPDYQSRYREGQFAGDRLPMNTSNSGYLREGTGNGFIFAVASYYRFDFSYYTNNGWWSTARLASAGRYGSPFEMVRRFVEEIMDESDSYSMDYVMYDVNANYYRSRYASRYRGYAFSDYLDLCYGSFSYNYNYCGGYGFRYGYPVIVMNHPNPRDPNTPPTKRMRIKPMVPDPSVPHGPPGLPTTQGRFPVSNPSEDAAIARHERMLRDARPRTEPQVQPMMRPEPRNEPRMDPRMTPRSEPRTEMRRFDPPPPQPRVEIRQASPPPPPPPKERPQKDNN